MLRKIIDRQVGEKSEEASRPSHAPGPKLFSDDVHWLDAPGLIIFFILMVVVFMQFFTRYVLNDSLGWTEEVARFLLVMLAFSGSVTAVRKGSHIFLEFFYRYLPQNFVKATSIIAELITTSFYGYMVYVGYQLAQLTRQNMVSIPVPKAAIYWAVAFCFALMALLSVWRLLVKWRMSNKEVLEEIETLSVKE
ncbi:TRAP transporter small permease [Enterovibrio sp. ZSDZ35]|uniref:TRAP transporter small permease protein n=1 Tax=Enterovibrio qingdaonensis TaxID=2899818 RepID=A0ABT5QP57_9GAMM|nr:TRAP transporter small permease [Enterovibrio sp. ZSDZ35]MDD1782773.1 TRAP transporter small permease [Enterovibrio sp. ZSDZ35]